MEKVDDHIEKTIASLDEYERSLVVPPAMLNALAENALRSPLYKRLEGANGEQWLAVAEARERHERRRSTNVRMELDADLARYHWRDRAREPDNYEPRAKGLRWLLGCMVLSSLIVAWAIYILTFGLFA